MYRILNNRVNKNRKVNNERLYIERCMIRGYVIDDNRIFRLFISMKHLILIIESLNYTFIFEQ